MTRDEIVRNIQTCSEDDLGDVLLELAAEYWITVREISGEDFVFLAGEVVEDREDD